MRREKPHPDQNISVSRRQRVFRGRNLLQIAFPLGGIGAGTICLNGYGGLQDFSIRNQPATSAQPNRERPPEAAFALVHIPDEDLTRLVEGPYPIEKIYNLGLNSQGILGGGHEGLPRFRQCTFSGEYPFGTVKLSDPSMPLKVKITAFNPFIPLDDINSSIPCAILEYTFENITDRVVPFQFSYHLSHLAPGSTPHEAPHSRNALVPGKGIYFYNEEPPHSSEFGSAALGVIGFSPRLKAKWLRGGWFDSLSALWREVSTGSFTENDGKSSQSLLGRNGGSILLDGSLDPGEKITYPIVIAWHFPNVNYTAGGLESPHGVSTGNSVRSCQPNQGCWRPFYVTQWQEAREVLCYIAEHYDMLRGRTQNFQRALFSSTLPGNVLDAVSANLGIIKSPTVLRQENGNLWGWEGCYSNRGCCHGSCTHVWNYAQSIPHLFPALERTLREQELERSMDADGHVNFRAALPDGETHHQFHAAADGQLGGIMKVYREWQISGDREWLIKMYPMTKRSMDFCIENWDPRHTGLLEEPHHNTYDIEFWGPDGMCSSFYLGALRAMVALARDAGFPEDMPFYEELARKGAERIDAQLFNGEYYEQRIQVEGLRDNSFDNNRGENAGIDPEGEKLLREQGPKYQYGSGCISDGVFGAWLAKLCGLESDQNQKNIRSNLKAIFEYNFKTNLWDHANPQRPGYALGDEPGLLLCTWPRGGKPVLPFVYSDEVWTGIEYQVASHLISEGFVNEGLTIVRATRSRFNGQGRNPWNEYECGNYYARAMSSYALLLALSGFWYSAVTKTLFFAPRLELDRFQTFFSTASGWGTISLENDIVEVSVIEGELEIRKLVLEHDQATRVSHPNKVARPDSQLRIPVEAAAEI